MLNLKNCQRLLNWLDAGAPHALFDMSLGFCTVEDYDLEDVHNQIETKGLGECGTVCCIAGMAAAMANDGINPSSQMWETIQHEAQMFLDLPSPTLFNHRLAPKNCTAQQAAQALRNVMKGETPW
jgi:hypothetical protein